MIRSLVAVSLLLGAALTVPTADARDSDKPEQLVKDRLKELKGEAAVVNRITDEAATRALPGNVVFAAIFRQFPIARVPPPPLAAQNIFILGADNKLNLITSAKDLETYFKSHARVSKEEANLKDVAVAWLLTAQELHQDGFYTFEVVKEATKVEATSAGKKATARSVVMKGGNGEVTVELLFDDKGKLQSASEKADLKPGPRPKCHATKLLDPDPIVRAIVEEDLLYMGRAAHDYLMEQRAKASPELQQAIDRLWQKIVEREGR
jgi:hypothetical protein